MTAKEFQRFLKVVTPGEGADIDLLSADARRVFTEDLAARWVRACRKLATAGYGDAVVDAYVRHSPRCARLVGPEAAFDLAKTVSTVAIKSGRQAAERLPAAAEYAAGRIKDEIRFRSWLGVIERFAALAPESVADVLERIETLMGKLNVSGLESWLLAGVRAAGGDSERRIRFFGFADPEAERWLNREAGGVAFMDVERRLKAYLTALWRLRVPIREPSLSLPETSRRRSGFDHGLIRMPPSFPGYRGQQAEELFRASLAHIGAHFMYSGDKFPVLSLKPIQVALVSLIEDARVEQLAMREFPGLRQVWLPFHIAQSTGSLTAPSLFARLSRSLIDLDFDDGDGWIRRARAMFFDHEDEWDDPQISRRIGGLIGNDLGQMRVQFNPRTYVVQPPYRDDNMGLWDFGDQDTPEMEDEELIFESVRIEQQERDDEESQDRDRDEDNEQDDANTASISEASFQEEGIPVAKYPEYDYVIGAERPDWTTIVEYQPRPGPSGLVKRILENQSDVESRIKALIGQARISRPQRLRRQAEGEYLDIDACIEAVISRRMGDLPDPRVYATSERRHRDLSVLVLLDVSESTKDKVLGCDESVLDLEREATVLLSDAMAGLGDPFAIAAFCSDRREDVRYYRIKDFGTPFDGLAQSYLAGLEGGLSTRIGAAMRHAGTDLGGQLTHRRLLLVITDGEPSDIDVSDRKYLVEDARKAVIWLANNGIDVFCVGLDSGGDSYLSRIFGRRNVVQIDRIDRLPEMLPMIYLRLTA